MRDIRRKQHIEQMDYKHIFEINYIAGLLDTGGTITKKGLTITTRSPDVACFLSDMAVKYSNRQSFKKTKLPPYLTTVWHTPTNSFYWRFRCSGKTARSLLRAVFPCMKHEYKKSKVKEYLDDSEPSINLEPLI